jgi:DNA-binding response OmpR family regulator
MTDDASTILVVEDDDATRTFLADNLTADGYDLLVADTAREGRRLFEHKYPDLAIVDVGLPDGSGLELIRSVREADGAVSRVDPRTPILVVSGRDGELDRLRGFERGADDWVGKPFSYPELRGLISRLGGFRVIRDFMSIPTRFRALSGGVEPPGCRVDAARPPSAVAVN